MYRLLEVSVLYLYK